MPRWTPEDPEGCRERANEAAGPSEHGYLYRLYWSRRKEEIRLIAYPILKITPMCWKIQVKFRDKPTYVSQNGHRKYACFTVAEAVSSYRARREAAVRHATWRLRDAEKSLAATNPRDPLNELYWLQNEEEPTPEFDDRIPEEEFA
jgi:hypothetical protein